MNQSHTPAQVAPPRAGRNPGQNKLSFCPRNRVRCTTERWEKNRKALQLADDLIRSKEATGRKKDLLLLDELRALKRLSPSRP